MSGARPTPDLRRAARLMAALLAAGAWLSAPAQAETAAAAPARFFDDFQHRSMTALQQAGWIVRDQAGHPGVPGARWGGDAVQLVPSSDAPDTQVLRLSARTDGSGAGTQQAQLCQQRKFLHGTTSAWVRFTDAPLRGADGDPVVQTFYLAAPLRFDYDPLFSEIDWEYLPNGGWGAPDTRLYGVSWQTVRLEPWDAHNTSLQHRASLEGWHQLTVQVEAERHHLWLDDRLLATHGGRQQPVQPMAISFNLWFSPDGLLPTGAGPRVWQQELGWVFHSRDEILRPDQVRAQVEAQQRAGTHWLDTVPAATPPLASPCDI